MYKRQQKHSISTDDAVDLFQKNRMYDKSRLFEFRINSHVNIYSLDGFSDYFYGYTVSYTHLMSRGEGQYFSRRQAQQVLGLAGKEDNSLAVISVIEGADADGITGGDVLPVSYTHLV